jgi:X-Pro dipeptidyl-peptidase C-terminal non-catalytic domain
VTTWADGFRWRRRASRRRPCPSQIPTFPPPATGEERSRSTSLIEPGRPFEYVIDLRATSNVFKAGHRIRLDVTSSSFPRCDHDQNTGHKHPP